MSKTIRRRALEEKAVELLRKQHPEVFEDSEMVAVAAVIVNRLSDELASMKPLARMTMIAGVMSLMFDMGSAAIRSTSLAESRNMKAIFVARAKGESVS